MPRSESDSAKCSKVIVHKLEGATRTGWKATGLWDRWKEVESYAIITTEANDLVRPLHERMPVILHPKDYGRWLDPMEADGELRSLLVSYPADLMESFVVDKLVNSIRCDGPECLQPAARPHSLFD